MKKTLIDLFEESVNRYPSNPFLWEKTNGQFQPASYTEVRNQVYTLGAGLQSLGVRKGDNMALLSEGRNAWIIGELAMFYAGACNVPLSVKLEESNDLLFRLTHAEVKFIMVSGNQLKKIRSIINQLPLVEKVIVFDEQTNWEEKEIPLSKVQEMGKIWLETHSTDEFLSVG
ncbi:MAG: AMP-binding protein, partial [Parabacteroides sp.]|nr:AMP-binding protein [Parabacteroides sp.]